MCCDIVVCGGGGLHALVRVKVAAREPILSGEENIFEILGRPFDKNVVIISLYSV